MIEKFEGYPDRLDKKVGESLHIWYNDQLYKGNIVSVEKPKELIENGRVHHVPIYMVEFNENDKIKE